MVKMITRLELTRSQILAFRRRAAALDERLPRGQRALRRAAWAGLQDSMPRAALLSIHARMAGTQPTSWEDPSLVQVWGPRFSTYVVAKRDLAVFTLSRLPDESGPLKRAQNIAAQLQSALASRRMAQGVAARAMGAQHANQLRYAAPTGTVRTMVMWCNACMAFVALRWKVIGQHRGIGRHSRGNTSNSKRVPNVSQHRLYRVEIDG
jgi:hypothetical protein